MKIQCHCGEFIVDLADEQSNKAHVIPDQNWPQLLEAIDKAIERSRPAPAAKEAACMQIRSLINRLSRQAWQCHSCGSIYIEDQQRSLQRLLPAADPASCELFRSRPS